MEKKLFSNGDKFQFIDFQMSHNELLLRSYPHGNRLHNIDLLFKGVFSINSVTTFKGLSILAVPKLKGQTVSVLDIENFIFKLIDGMGVESYVDAAAFGVFNNKLDFGVSSLGDYTWSDENKCEYWSHEDEEFKKLFLKER